MLNSRILTGSRATLTSLVLLVGCSSIDTPMPQALPTLPPEAEFCLAASRLVTRTDIPMQLVIHEDFDAFVKSKALIDGPILQQYHWRDDRGGLVGISCKLKSADHLLATFGPVRAGPDGACQDMNRAVYTLIAREVAEPVFPRVEFDPAETVFNEANPAMTGPDWLAPLTLTGVDADGTLRIFTRGFIVGFGDPRFARLPERFRGVHYCHFIAPAHLRDLLSGRAAPGAVIGRRIDVN